MVKGTLALLALAAPAFAGVIERGEGKGWGGHEDKHSSSPHAKPTTEPSTSTTSTSSTATSETTSSWEETSTSTTSTSSTATSETTSSWEEPSSSRHHNHHHKPTETLVTPSSRSVPGTTVINSTPCTWATI
ncbi:putative cell surface protein, partial [Aspergillus glaucus CBS 516.65]